MIQTKRCKGQNKAHGAEACGKDTDVKKRKYGLCPTCYWHWMQNSESGKVHYQKQFLPKVKVKTKKEQKKRDKETRESLKSIAALIREARVPFQKWIRLRDANDGCISCPSTNVKIWHAGHYKKAELFTGVIFNEMNVNKQCEKCNTFLGGNESEYRIGLVKKYGEEEVKRLEELADKVRQYSFSRHEIAEIKKYYQEKIKQFN